MYVHGRFWAQALHFQLSLKKEGKFNYNCCKIVTPPSQTYLGTSNMANAFDKTFQKKHYPQGSTWARFYSMCPGSSTTDANTIYVIKKTNKKGGKYFSLSARHTAEAQLNTSENFRLQRFQVFLPFFCRGLSRGRMTSIFQSKNYTRGTLLS